MQVAAGGPALDDRRPGPSATPVPASRDRALRRAILRTLVYADLFEYPLSAGEVQRFLAGETASPARVATALHADRALRQYVGQTGDWFHLDGRSHLVEVRRQRAKVAARLWPLARHYGAVMARLPFVRLVAVTGALAMDNTRPDDDIDFFLLVQPGRPWLCRVLVLAVVRLAARRGILLCPNFLLSTDHLRLSQRNLFTAHEVVQLVPLAGGPWYRTLLEANRWVADYLPNALPNPSSVDPSAKPWWPTRLAGQVLSSGLFGPIERWEMGRKVRRLTLRLEREGGNCAFSADECRGHFAAHDARILAAYRARTADFPELGA